MDRSQAEPVVDRGADLAERGLAALDEVEAGRGGVSEDVLDGELRLVLGEQEMRLKPGEAAEFDTRAPHWFGTAGTQPAEVLALLGSQGERTHVRATATINNRPRL